jgi:hypothetical protein
MEGKKKYIILLAILLIYGIIVFVFFSGNIKKKNSGASYIIVGPSTRWKFEEGKFLRVNDSKEYNSMDFKVYDQDKYLGKYNVVFMEKMYLFDGQKNSIKYNGNIFAINGNLKADIIRFKQEEINKRDYKILEELLKNEKIEEDISKITLTKVMIDIDGDGTKETIYTASNAFDETVQTSLSYIYLIRKNKAEILISKKMSVERMLSDNCVPFINHIIDIDRDKNYEFIIGCEGFSMSGTQNILIDNYKNNYNILISN